MTWVIPFVSAIAKLMPCKSTLPVQHKQHSFCDAGFLLSSSSPRFLEDSCRGLYIRRVLSGLQRQLFASMQGCCVTGQAGRLQAQTVHHRGAVSLCTQSYISASSTVVRKCKGCQVPGSALCLSSSLRLACGTHGAVHVNRGLAWH
jgi:hypothetical protein